MIVKGREKLCGKRQNEIKLTVYARKSIRAGISSTILIGQTRCWNTNVDNCKCNGDMADNTKIFHFLYLFWGRGRDGEGVGMGRW